MHCGEIRKILINKGEGRGEGMEGKRKKIGKGGGGREGQKEAKEEETENQFPWIH